MNVLNQPVLCLNSLWLPLAPKTVKEAIVAMMGGAGGHNPPAFGLDQEFEVDADGNINWGNMIYASPVKWDEWVNLPVREDQNDEAIRTAGGRVIRAPRVIVQPNFSRMPVISPKPTKDAILKRDGGVCQYTGRKLTRGQGNIDHVIPRHHGGKNTFENMVWCDKDLNSKKGNRRNEEIGLKLIRRPKAPSSIPLSATITEARHPAWQPFIMVSPKSS